MPKTCKFQQSRFGGKTMRACPMRSSVLKETAQDLKLSTLSFDLTEPVVCGIPAVNPAHPSDPRLAKRRWQWESSSESLERISCASTFASCYFWGSA